MTWEARSPPTGAHLQGLCVLQAGNPGPSASFSLPALPPPGQRLLPEEGVRGREHRRALGSPLRVCGFERAGEAGDRLALVTPSPSRRGTVPQSQGKNVTFISFLICYSFLRLLSKHLLNPLLHQTVS